MRIHPAPAAPPAIFDVAAIRALFPALQQQVHGKPLVYLDNAATTQKPQAVIDALVSYYAHDNANVHRGVHALSERATAAFESARKTVQRFVNARSDREIVFTRNATESINLVARAWGDWQLNAGDEVLITAMEHHSNIVPWQMACARTGAILRVAPIDDYGDVVMDEFARMLTPKTRMLAVTHMSNALGTINPVGDMVKMARSVGATVLIDGSQAAYHQAVDVQALDPDFYVFTGHKVYGPTGIGVLYGRESVLQAMPPFLGGGDMISSVTFEKSEWNELPYKFEAGTPNIADAIALGAALDFVQSIGFDAIGAHESAVLAYATAQLSAVPGLKIIGTAKHKASVVSFVIDDIHPHDIGTIVDREGVAIRTGHHCAQPVMDRYGIPATARASLAMYNTTDDVDALVGALARVRQLLG
ncbi:MAG: cysteine desulfurase [Acidobacteria bacterium]|jgi:cysteine desulfurase / selenocysteine lyase|nr:cysteine desulfurase [Acidobacteriota bacterium]